MIREQEWEGGMWVVGEKEKEKRKNKEKKISYVGGKGKKEGWGISYGNREG